jgi:hypothetical protein
VRLQLYFSCSLNAQKVYIQRRQLIPDDKVYPESAQALSTTKIIYSTSYHDGSLILIHSHLVGDEKREIDNENLENYLP